MKSLLQALMVIVLLSGVTSCTRNNLLANSTNNTTSPSDKFRISLFFDDRDETSRFTAYRFEFVTGGQLKATAGTTTIIGTWTESATRFNIVFPNGPLDDLNDNWMLEARSPTTIFLREDDPSKTDKLQFTKL